MDYHPIVRSPECDSLSLILPKGIMLKRCDHTGFLKASYCQIANMLLWNNSAVELLTELQAILVRLLSGQVIVQGLETYFTKLSTILDSLIGMAYGATSEVYRHWTQLLQQARYKQAVLAELRQ